MKKKLSICIALVSILMVIFDFHIVTAENSDRNKTQRKHAKQTQDKSDKNDKKQKKYSSETILIKYKDGIQETDAETVFADIGVEVKKKCKKTGITILKVKNKNKTIETMIKDLNESSLIKYAEPDYVMQADVSPNDPSFNDLWGLHNTGVFGTADADIDAPEAWDITTGNANIVVAVIDTGVDYTHEDLAANMWINPYEIAGNNIDDDGNGYIDDIYGIDTANKDSDPYDDNGHGTHCSGTIGAAGNNGIGIVGINWNIKIMACKFLDSGGFGYTTDAIECLEYILTHKMNGVNVKLTSNSWGGGEYSQALYDAIQATENEGMLFVAAAGNDGLDTDATPHYPSSYNLNNIISVAATNNNDELSGFSNYGVTSVDLAAPGSNILSTIPGNAYSYKSGTSMATPHVAGAVALVWDQNLSADYIAIKNLIMNTVDPLSPLSAYTIAGGRLNVNNALSCESGNLRMYISPGDGFEADYDANTSVFATLSECSTSIIGATVTVVTSEGVSFNLLDDGVLPDTAANDGIYSGNWTPSLVGQLTLTVEASYAGNTLTEFISGTVIKNYACNDETTYNWIDATTGVNTGIKDDDSSTEISIGFDFEFYGNTYNTVKVSSNGYLAFGDTDGSVWYNSIIPSSNIPNNIIAPFWDDLNPSKGGAIYYLLEGTSPNRTFTIEWHNIPHYSDIGQATFEVTLYEGSNNILFQYEEVSFGDSDFDYGLSATVGIEDANGNIGKLYSYNSAAISNGLAIQFSVQEDSLYAYYTFDEGAGAIAGDSSGNGNDGTIMGGSAWTTGENGGGLGFNGVDTYVDIGDIDLTDAFSIAAWIKITSLGKLMILGKTFQTYQFFVSPEGNIVFQRNSATPINYDAGLIPDTWYHVAVTFDMTNGMSLFLNGNLVSTNGDISVTNENDLATKIGVTGYAPKHFFFGTIDDVRIYRQALTSLEIQNLYGRLDTNGLLSYYAFEEGSGQVAADSSGNVNNGTINGGAVWTTGENGNGGGLDFDGADSYVDIGDMDLADAFSITAWIKITSLGKLMIVGKTYQTYQFFISPEGNLIFQRNSMTPINYNAGLAPGIWYHVAVTFDTADGMSLYLNGSLVDTNGDISVTNENDIVTKIGATGYAPKHFFFGTIDEVRIYHRALTGQEVIDLYNL
ncbi:MAG: S8 family serine peptidase [Candidatus Kuenenia sp.]|nr:S8 family serine peptidase [Candidatus Kuenenia hertensis]